MLKTSSSVISVVVATILLLTVVTSGLTSKDSFADIYEVYGNSFLDISLTGSFISASGGSVDEPNTAVDQDISMLYDLYEKDNRVDYAVFTQNYQNINIEFDGQNYAIETSNNVPILNELIAGRVPEGNSSEVIVPENFLLQTGLSANEVIGKEIVFNSGIYNWETGSPVLKNVSTTLEIVGVASNLLILENGMELNIDDSFFLSKSAIDDLRVQAGITNDNVSFIIRAKTPEDMISIKDELNSKGIVPLGNFKLVEDIVRLNQSTMEQSQSSNIVLALLAFVVIVIISLATGIMRKKEITILKVCGYKKSDINKIILSESIVISAIALAFILIYTLITNIDTTLISLGVLILLSSIGYLITLLTVTSFKSFNHLKTGEK